MIDRYYVPISSSFCWFSNVGLCREKKTSSKSSYFI